MKTIIMQNLDLNKFTLIKKSNEARIYKMQNGEILKIIEPDVIIKTDVTFDGKASLDTLLKERGKIKDMEEIIMPTGKLIDGPRTIGYKMKNIKGMNYTKCAEYINPFDIKTLTQLTHKVEKVVKKRDDIVFPDLCTLDNIIFDDKGNPHFIDIDGIQIGEYTSPFTCQLTDFELIRMAPIINNLTQNNIYKLPQHKNYFGLFEFDNAKYVNDIYFTKNLDALNIIETYFLTVFHADFFGTVVDLVKNGFTIDEALKKTLTELNIKDPEFIKKLTLLFKNEENEFLGDSILNLAEDNNLVPLSVNQGLVKRLEPRKRIF